MKKLILLMSLLTIGLSGCYVVPHRGQDDGYRGDRDHHERRDQGNDHDGERRDRDVYR